MITIQIDGKTYIARRSKMSMLMPISEWISKGYLEEVKEKPLSQKRAEAIERGKQHSTEYYSALSILEKLRADITQRIKEYESKLSSKNIRKQTADDKILLIRMNELEIVLLSLTCLENSSEIPYSSPISKMETTQFTPGQEDFLELPKINDTNLLEDAGVWTPTPGQEIEVSNDGEKWEKRIFRKLEDNEYIASEDTSMKYLKSFKFARPIKIEPELPEFNWDWVMKQLEENQKLNLIPFTALAVMATHIGVMDKALARQKTTK